jgi:hypothetical protein
MEAGKWYPAVGVIVEAAKLGYDHTNTLRRAKKALGVQSRKTGNGWEWMRPVTAGN